MKLVPADYVSDHDRELQRILSEHPDLKWYLTLLINSYREKIRLCAEEMREQHIDVADLLNGMDKTDNQMRRIDLPLLDSTEDWVWAREQYAKS